MKVKVIWSLSVSRQIQTSERRYLKWKWIAVITSDFTGASALGWFAISQFIPKKQKQKLILFFRDIVVACLDLAQSSFWGGQGLIGDLEAALLDPPPNAWSGHIWRHASSRLPASRLPVKWVNSAQKKMYKIEFNHIFLGSHNCFHETFKQ